MLDFTRLDKRQWPRPWTSRSCPRKPRRPRSAKAAPSRASTALPRSTPAAPTGRRSSGRSWPAWPDVEIGTGIAFPFGSVPAAVKAFETEDAVRRGCTAVDMVMNVGALKDAGYGVVEEELRLFVQAAGAGGDQVHPGSLLPDRRGDRHGLPADRRGRRPVCQDLVRPVRRPDAGAVPGDAGNAAADAMSS